MNNEQLREVKMAWARGEEVQYLDLDGWKDWGKGHWLNVEHYLTWRIKPKTIRIGEYDVPEPLRSLCGREEYWYVSTSNLHPQWREMTDSRFDKTALSRGICHATKEAAQKHLNALLSFTREKL